MVEELNYFNSRVWEVEDAHKLVGEEGKRAIRTRWVVCNKGDNVNYDVRARLVACEIATTKSDEYFASTPPLEAKRMLMSQMATRRTNKTGKPRCLSSIDIKKAYFNGIPRRRLHVCLPPELGLSKKAVAHLRRCVYGTRDAGLI